MEDIIKCPSCGQRNRVPSVAQGSPRCGRCHSPLPWVVEAEDDSFAAATATTEALVFVDLWAPWCGPCRQMEPALEEMARTFAGKLKVVRVNVDKSPATAARFQAMSIPTLLLVRDGEVIDRVVGAMPASALLEWVSSKLPEAKAKA